MRALIPLALMLAACGDDGDKISDSPRTAGWSVGAPKAYPISGTTVTFPEQGEVNYVTRATGSLANKSRITLRYRLDGEVTGCANQPASISLYFQRKGDDWRSDGGRWWASFATVYPLVPGEHEVTAPLDGPWTSVMYMNSTAPGFVKAKQDAARVGFTFGDCTGLGHGATGPATFTIVSFAVE